MISSYLSLQHMFPMFFIDIYTYIFDVMVVGGRCKACAFCGKCGSNIQKLGGHLLSKFVS